MAAAVPFAIKAGSMIGGSWLGKKLSGASGDQKAAMTGTQNAANAVGQYAQPFAQAGMNLVGRGNEAMGGAMDYYGRILKGNRFQMRQALAPELKSAMDYYAGAAKSAGANLRGGARDYALAELDRSKVGNMAMMIPQARQHAAAAMGDLAGTAYGAGTTLGRTGVDAASNAAYINSGLFNQATQIRNQEGEGGKAWGGLLYDAAQQLPWGKGTLKSGRVPNMPGPTTPTYPTLPTNQGASQKLSPQIPFYGSGF